MNLRLFKSKAIIWMPYSDGFFHSRKRNKNDITYYYKNNSSRIKLHVKFRLSMRKFKKKIPSSISLESTMMLHVRGVKIKVLCDEVDFAE